MASASEEKRDEVVPRNKATSLLPHDIKEIETVSQYATRQQNKMKELKQDISKIGKLKRVWDSQVPEINRRFYYFFTLKESNKEEVLAEIQKYLDFYEKMDKTASGIKSDEGGEEKDAYSLILELYECLTDLAKAAGTGKKTTASSTVCALHKEFISKHEKLENMIKRVECVSLKQSWKKATEGLEQSLKAVDGLRSDLQSSQAKYDELCGKFDEVLSQNKKLIHQQNFLLEENGKIMLQQQILLDDNKHMKEQTDLLIGIVASFAKKEKEKEKEKENNNKPN